MTHFLPRAALSAFAAIMAAIAVNGPASAAPYTRVGDANEFRLGNFSFSLSLAPNAVQAGSVSVAVPNLGTGNFTVRGTGDNRQFVFATSTHGGGTYIGNTATTSAPILSDGSAYEGYYLGTVIKAGAPVSARAYTTTTGTIDLPGRGMAFLWGSVSAGDRMTIGTKTGTQYGSADIYGSDILAAAASLGMSQGAGDSFYVTVNAVGVPNLFRGAAYSDGMTAMEWVPLEFSTSNIVSSSVLGIPVPSGDGAIVGAPAPVLGASPAGGMLGLGLLGMLGLGRSRRRASRLAAT